MFTLKSSRQKRSSSATGKYKNNPLNQQNLNLTHLCSQINKSKAYGQGQKNRGKQNRKCLVGVDFPQQAVKFKMIDSNSRNKAKQQWQQAKLLSKYTFSNHLGQAYSNNNKEHQLTFFKEQPSHQQHKMQEPVWKSLPAKTQKDYLNRFKQAIDKIFKGLDIFNRGTISQTNINKWIPQQALYFLGNIFQNIREERLHLSFQQFLNKCIPILQQASEEDIIHFLECVNGKDYIHTISINSEEKDKQSTVELRIGQVEQPRLESQQYACKNYIPLIPFEEIIGNIKQQQKNISLRLAAQKSYQKQQGLRNTQGEGRSNKVEGQIFAQFNTAREIVSNFGSEKKAIKINKLEDMPYFNFNIKENKVIQSQRILKEENKGKNLESNKIQQPYFRNSPNLTFTDFQSISRPKTSRIVHQKVPKEPVFQIQTQRFKNADTDKLDRLSSKLQEYIKFNKTKIEKHRNFIRENSAPKSSN